MVGHCGLLSVFDRSGVKFAREWRWGFLAFVMGSFSALTPAMAGPPVPVKRPAEVKIPPLVGHARRGESDPPRPTPADDARLRAEVVQLELEQLRADERNRQVERMRRWQAEREKQLSARQEQERHREELAIQRADDAQREAQQQDLAERQAAVEQERARRRASELNPVDQRVRLKEAPRRNGPVPALDADLAEQGMPEGVVDAAAGQQVRINAAANEALIRYLREQRRQEQRQRWARRAVHSIAARHAAVAAYEANARGVNAYHQDMQARTIRALGW